MPDTLTKDERGYHSAPDDKGKVTTYVPFEHELRYRLNEVRRFASWDTGPDGFRGGTAQMAAVDLKQEPPPPLPPGPEKRINATTFLGGPPSLGTISTEGTKAVLFGGPAIEFHVGPERLSGYRHYRQSRQDTDKDYGSLFLTIFLSQERMDWLWNELAARPNAELSVEVTAPLYVSLDTLDGGGEVHGTSYLEEHTRLAVTNVNIEVMDPKPYYPPPPKPAPPPPHPPEPPQTDNLLRQMLNLQAWGLGAVIVAVLFGVGRCNGVGG